MRRVIVRRVSPIFTVPFFFSAFACSQPPAPPPPTQDAFDRAVRSCSERLDQDAIIALRAALETDPDACQRALLEPVFHSGLRDTDAFREAIHDAAVKHRISRLTLAPDDEPGEWIEITGRVVESGGGAAPVSGAIVRLFATDDQGRYHPEIEGETTPRLFGTLVADERGEFAFRTVRPGPYPGTRNARHVHISVRAGDKRLAAPGYVVFDDDPLLGEPQNAEQRDEAVRIAMTRGENGDLRGTLVLPMR